MNSHTLSMAILWSKPPVKLTVWLCSTCSTTLGSTIQQFQQAVDGQHAGTWSGCHPKTATCFAAKWTSWLVHRPHKWCHGDTDPAVQTMSLLEHSFGRSPSVDSAWLSDECQLKHVAYVVIADSVMLSCCNFSIYYVLLHMCVLYWKMLILFVDL